MGARLKESYAQIGEFGLAFNRLDTVLGVLIVSILGLPERAVANAIVEREDSIARKTEMARDVLTAVLEEHAELKPDVEKIRKALQRLDTLRLKRNDFIHGVIGIDTFNRPDELHLEMPDGSSALVDEREVAVLTQQTWALVREMQSVFYDLWNKPKALRAAVRMDNKPSGCVPKGRPGEVSRKR